MKKVRVMVPMIGSLSFILASGVPVVAHAANTGYHVSFAQSSSNMDLVNFNGSANTTFDAKGKSFTVDPAAVAAVTGNSNFAQMNSDFKNGKIITFINQEGGKLNSSLLRKSFNSPGVDISNRFADSSMHVSAIAIAKIPGDAYAETFEILSNGAPSNSEIQTQIQDLVSKAKNKFASKAVVSHSSAKNSSVKYATYSTVNVNSPTYSSGGLDLYDNGYIVAQYQWGYDFVKHVNGSTSVWDMQRTDSVTPGYTEVGGIGVKNGWRGDLLDGIYESIGVGEPGNINTPYPFEDMTSWAPSQPVSATQINTSIGGDGVPSFTVTYNESGSLSPSSLTSVYGAWENGYLTGTGYPLNGAYYPVSLAPAIRATNTQGYMCGFGDFNLTMCSSAGISTASTGDIGVDFSVPDR